MLSSVWRGNITWFALGLFGGALLVGAVFGAFGDVLSLAPSGAVSVAGTVGIGALMVAELWGRGGDLAQNRRLVPQTITFVTPQVGAVQFGFELGTGLRTFLPSAVPHALAVALLSFGSTGAGLTAGAGFAIGRLAMPVLRNSYPDPRLWDRATRSRFGFAWAAAGAFGLGAVPIIFGD